MDPKVVNFINYIPAFEVCITVVGFACGLFISQLFAKGFDD